MGIRNRRTTQSGGMHRCSNAAGTSATGCQGRRRVGPEWKRRHSPPGSRLVNMVRPPNRCAPSEAGPGGRKGKQGSEPARFRGAFPMITPCFSAACTALRRPFPVRSMLLTFRWAYGSQRTDEAVRAARYVPVGKLDRADEIIVSSTICRKSGAGGAMPAPYRVAARFPRVGRPEFDPSARFEAPAAVSAGRKREEEFEVAHLLEVNVRHVAEDLPHRVDDGERRAAVKIKARRGTRRHGI